MRQPAWRLLGQAADFMATFLVCEISPFRRTACKVFKGSSASSTGPALPWFKDNKTIRVADEDAPEEYRGQQSIFLRRQDVFPGFCRRREGYLLNDYRQSLRDCSHELAGRSDALLASTL